MSRVGGQRPTGSLFHNRSRYRLSAEHMQSLPSFLSLFLSLALFLPPPRSLTFSPRDAFSFVNWRAVCSRQTQLEFNRASPSSLSIGHPIPPLPSTFHPIPTILLFFVSVLINASSPVENPFFFFLVRIFFFFFSRGGEKSKGWKEGGWTIPRIKFCGSMWHKR